jgi:hypothetical protein
MKTFERHFCIPGADSEPNQDTGGIVSSR